MVRATPAFRKVSWIIGWTGDHERQSRLFGDRFLPLLLLLASVLSLHGLPGNDGRLCKLLFPVYTSVLLMLGELAPAR